MRRLGLTTDSGLNRITVNSMLRSLSNDTTFTNQLLANADICISAFLTSGVDLTADQQGVYVLACLKLRSLAVCALDDDDKTLCLHAMTLLGCPIGITPLVGSDAISTCRSRMTPSTKSSNLKRNVAFVKNQCRTKEEKALNVANCSLQEAGLASGDTVDLSAVRRAIADSECTTITEEARQRFVVSQCEDDTANDAFLDCWATEAVIGCEISIAERLAICYPDSTNSIDSTDPDNDSGDLAA